MSSISSVELEVLDEDVCDRMAARPGHTIRVPSTKIRMFDNTELTATRHHIIPYNVLQTFFNTALNLSRFLNPLGHYINDQLRRIYAEVEAHPNVGILIRPPPNTITDPRLRRAVQITQRMQAAFVWMPGNLFYGPPPNKRSDDPGENIEPYAGVIIGSANYRVLEQLYRNLVDFNDSPAAQTITNFNRIIDQINVIENNRREPYEFVLSNWEEDNGKFKIKVSRSRALVRSNQSSRVVAEVDSNPYAAAIEFCRAFNQAPALRP